MYKISAQIYPRALPFWPLGKISLFDKYFISRQQLSIKSHMILLNVSPNLDATKSVGVFDSFYAGTEYKHTRLKLEAPWKGSSLIRGIPKHHSLLPVLLSFIWSI